MKIITELLNNNIPNKMYPFFWQHGESNEKILEYIEKIQEGGINNLCIESRPHPDFLGEAWWKSMDFIIAEAKKRNMKIWILDDARFPTGHANGKVPDELKKKYICCHRYDIIGTSSNMELDVRIPSGRESMIDKRHQGDVVYKVIQVERNLKDNTFVESSAKDITNNLLNGIVHLSLEKKHYGVFVIYETVCGKEDSTKDYLDPTRKESTRILINEVYEKHYQRYSDEFGKTITAFFSDEPRFGNVKGSGHIIGKSDMPLPWNDNIATLLKDRHNIKDIELINLFEGENKNANFVRWAYMDVASYLYSENFSKELGKWCEEHSIKYVGHIIEDNNAHGRLGYGPGHYFRSMSGQHMAGIDIIGGQVVPGMNYYHDSMSTGGSDGEFYHYTLCKLGASCAKLDENKNGDLMCEAFGAYGWVEGLKMMKWITDHMISHGVNHIVPHAFSPKDFPDWDCPPHFYAHGNNPQYPYFNYWANYTNRLCNLMSNGYQVCKTGVLYHAFNEWHGDTMFMQKVLKELQCHQIDSNIISEDYLLDSNIKENRIEINGYLFDVLIIPETKLLPKILNERIKKISNSVKVIFINSIPSNYQGDGEVVELNELSQRLVQLNINEVSLDTDESELVYYHYQKEDGEVFMFSNEDVFETINTNVTLEGNKELMIYDAYTNEEYELNYKHENGKTIFNIELQPYVSIVLVTGTSTNKKTKKGTLIKTLDESLNIFMKSYNKESYEKISALNTNDLRKDFPNFTGNIKYEYEIKVSNNELLLEIEEVYEIVEVLVNGVACGVKITSPYVFDLSNALIKGNNKITIITTNNLGRNQRDITSMYIPAEPIGIISDINLYERIIS